MINIVIPLAGNSNLSSDLGYPYPFPLIELNKVPLINYVINNLKESGTKVNLIIILKDEDCKIFHLDNTIKQLCENNVTIVKLLNKTAGALCSILMGIDYFYNNYPLIIANADQVFTKGVVAEMINDLSFSDCDAMCPTFESVHPRWSYLKLENKIVVEATEKNPFSNKAIAGFYYFKSGEVFSNLAKRAIINKRNTDGIYYTSSVLNEYILDGLNMRTFELTGNKYYSLFTAQRVLDFEKTIKAGKINL